MIVEIGWIIVCRKSDSHCPWWLATIITGVLGIFDAPSISQFIPQNNFKLNNIKEIQMEAIFDSLLGEERGYSINIKAHITGRLEYSNILNIKLPKKST